MKKILWFPALLLLLCFTSCKKDSNTTSTTPADQSYISFNTSKSFNGSTSTLFKSIDSNNTLYCSHQTSSPVATTFGGTQTTSGITTTAATIYMYVPGETTGSVRFEDGNFFTLSTTVGGAAQAYYQMTSGTLQINTLTDHTIGGTFSGKAVSSTDSFNVTNGLFYGKF